MEIQLFIMATSVYELMLNRVAFSGYIYSIHKVKYSLIIIIIIETFSFSRMH